MKLRRHPYTLNGQPIARDEFAWVHAAADPHPTAIAFWCPNGTKRVCMLYVTLGEAQHPRFHWDGNLDAPTLSPSIGCDHRCGWHGHIVAGEPIPSSPVPDVQQEPK